MKFKKIVMSTAVTLSLAGASVAPIMANASSNQSTNQQENVQTQVNNKKEEYINSLLDGISKINSEVQKSHPKDQKSAQFKKNYLSDSNISSLKSDMNKGWNDTVQKNKMSSKQQLKAVEDSINEMKKSQSNNNPVDVGKSLAQKINNGQIRSNASSNQSTNQQENVQTQVDNKKEEYINSLLDGISKINSEVQKSHPKDQKSAQFKKNYLSDSNISSLKSDMNKGWNDTVQKNKMSSKQQLKAVEDSINEMKKSQSNNNPVDVGKSLVQKINNGQV